MTFARGLLKQGFDFNTQESYNYDRKKSDWPKDQAELDTLWRERTMNDWLRLKLAGKTDDDIRKTLDKRYAGYIDRVKQLDGEDVFQSFMNSYAESTDPHTDYLGPARGGELRHLHEALAGRHRCGAAGARRIHRDPRDRAGGPAAKSGKVHVGDRIVGDRRRHQRPDDRRHRLAPGRCGQTHPRQEGHHGSPGNSSGRRGRGRQARDDQPGSPEGEHRRAGRQEEGHRDQGRWRHAQDRRDRRCRASTPTSVRAAKATRTSRAPPATCPSCSAS